MARSLFHPRYWGTGCFFILMWLIVQLPFSWQLRLGRGLGLLVYYFARYRRKITAINLQLCFPELDAKQQRQLLKKTMISNSLAIIETAFSWWATDARLAPLIEMRGAELANHLLDEGKGVLLIGAHFSCLDLGGRILAQFCDFDVIYRKNKNALIDHLILENRSKSFKHVIERNNIRQALKSLRSGRMVWYAPDQDYGAKHSVFAPFYGVPAASITATRRFAKIRNTEVLFISYHRKEDDSGYLVQITDSIKDYPSDDEVADASNINGVIEKFINLHPDQYLWVHRRFKTRPDKSKAFYDGGYQELLNATKPHT